jgi:hypothetical protein
MALCHHQMLTPTRPRRRVFRLLNRSADGATLHGWPIIVGGGTETTIFYVRIADPGEARAAARALAGVGADAVAIIVSLLSESTIKFLEEKFGLADGQVMHWTKL